MIWIYVIFGMMGLTLAASRWARMPWPKGLLAMLLVPPILFGSAACLFAGVFFLLYLVELALRTFGIDVEDYVPIAGLIISAGIVLVIATLYFVDQRRSNIQSCADNAAADKESHNNSLKAT